MHHSEQVESIFSSMDEITDEKSGNLHVDTYSAILAVRDAL